MKKKLIRRSVSGVPVGITIGYLLSILFSLAYGGGRYSPCVPELCAITGSEISAVLLQALLCGVLGAGFGASSMLWELEAWGIARQTGIYFLTVSLIMMPIAYALYWMEHSVGGFLSYFGIFALIFALVWLLQYARIKHSIKKINLLLREQRDRAK